MEKETHYAKAKWAEKLEVSVSGYYTWLQEREERQAALKALEDRVIAIFEEWIGSTFVECESVNYMHTKKEDKNVPANRLTTGSPA